MPTMAHVDAEIARTLRTIAVGSISTGAAGTYGTFWTGTYPGTGGRACADATAGAMFPAPADDTGRLAYARAPLTGSMTNLFLYDRLVDVSGLSALSTSLQAVTHPALPRETTGEGVLAWVEIAGGATSSPITNLTFNYTNQAGAAKTAITPLVAGWAGTVRRAIPLNLAPGDTGVRSWQSLQNDAAAATAGDVAIVLGRMIQFLPQTTTAVSTAYQRSNHVNAVRGGLPRVRAGACVMAFGIGNTANLGNILLTYAVTELAA